jgi:DNA-binding MarR family transcriptional regulator
VSAASKSRLRLWLRLLKTTQWIEGEIRERFRTEFATTLPRFDVMAALHRNPDGLRMSHISGLLNVSGGNVTGIVDRLEGDGLAERRPVPGDRRAYDVGLTSSGLAHFERLARAHEEWVDELLASVSGAEAAELTSFFGRTATKKQIEAAE